MRELTTGIKRTREQCLLLFIKIFLLNFKVTEFDWTQVVKKTGKGWFVSFNLTVKAQLLPQIEDRARLPHHSRS